MAREGDDPRGAMVGYQAFMFERDGATPKSGTVQAIGPVHPCTIDAPETEHAAAYRAGVADCDAHRTAP